MEVVSASETHVFTTNGKFLNDKEKKKIYDKEGVVSGTCVEETAKKIVELGEKYGYEYFDIVLTRRPRMSCVATRKMLSPEQLKEYDARGEFIDHIILYNHKLGIYIDDTNGNVAFYKKEDLFNFAKLKHIYHWNIDTLMKVHKFKKEEIEDIGYGLLNDFSQKIYISRWHKHFSV